MYLRRTNINNIEFENGARIFKCKNSDRFALTDSDKNVMYIIDEKRPIKDFIDEYIECNNECADCIGAFTTDKGNEYILWFDFEVNEYYLSLYNKNIF